MLWALGIVVVILAVIGTYRSDRKAQTLVAENRQFLKERDSALAIIKEHADSARTIQPRVEWRERVITRLVTKTDTLSIQAYTQADSGQWEAAYRTRTQEADTLRVALNVQTLRAEDAIKMSAYWQLAFIADSTRREEAEQRLATTTDALAKRTKWYRRLGVSVGYGLFAHDRTVYAKPNINIGVKLWP